MPKKLILIFAVVFFLSACRFAFASLIINEIMYDLDGSDIDWVEIYNPDSADVDLTTLKLLISNSSSNHSIASNQGGAALHSGDYGVIVVSSAISSFTSKWGNSGNIFTSSFSLPNDTAKVEINNGDKNSPFSSVTYNSSQGATEDGKSLQIVGGSWVASSPTPGKVNQAPVSDNTGNTGSGNSNNDSNTNTNSNATTSSVPASGPGGGSSPIKAGSLQKMKAQITSNSIAYVGIPFTFQGMAFGIHGEQLLGGKYFWNFGDGDSRELSAYSTDKFTHTYFYPGDYNVTFEYYPNYFADTPDATAKITIQAIVPTVVISSVGGAGDFFVELSNDTSYATDISNWILASDYKSFKIPKNTILESNKKMIISPRVTNFSMEDKNTLKLMNSQGETAFNYSPVAFIPPKTVASASVALKEKLPPAGGISEKLASDAKQIPVNNLLASAFSSGIINNNETGSQSTIIIFIGSLIFIGAAAYAVYFIRQKKTMPGAQSDFQIIDE